jgi:uncharacterized membrane protein YadS
MNKKAITQIVILAVTLVAAVGALIGIDTSSIDPETIGALAGAAVTVIAPVVLAWRNTPITDPAKKAEAVIKAGKQGYDSLTDAEKDALKEIVTEVEAHMKK